MYLSPFGNVGTVLLGSVWGDGVTVGYMNGFGYGNKSFLLSLLILSISIVPITLLSLLHLISDNQYFSFKIF